MPPFLPLTRPALVASPFARHPRALDRAILLEPPNGERQDTQARRYVNTPCFGPDIFATVSTRRVLAVLLWPATAAFSLDQAPMLSFAGTMARLSGRAGDDLYTAIRDALVERRLPLSFLATDAEEVSLDPHYVRCVRFPVVFWWLRAWITPTDAFVPKYFTVLFVFLCRAWNSPAAAQRRRGRGSSSDCAAAALLRPRGF